MQAARLQRPGSSVPRRAAVASGRSEKTALAAAQEEAEVPCTTSTVTGAQRSEETRRDYNRGDF